MTRKQQLLDHLNKLRSHVGDPVMSDETASQYSEAAIEYNIHYYADLLGRDPQVEVACATITFF